MITLVFAAAGVASLICVGMCLARLHPAVPLVTLLSMIGMSFAASADWQQIGSLLVLSCLILGAQICVPIAAEILSIGRRLICEENYKTIWISVLRAALPATLLGAAIYLQAVTVAWLTDETVYAISVGSPEEAINAELGRSLQDLNCAQADQTSRLVCKVTGSVKGDVDDAIVRSFVFIEEEISLRIETALSEISEQGDVTAEKVGEAIWYAEDAAVPHSLGQINPALVPSKPNDNCRIWNLLTRGEKHRERCAEYKLLSSLNQIYATWRASAQARYEKSLEQASAEAEDLLAASLAGVRQFQSNELAELERSALRFNARYFGLRGAWQMALLVLQVSVIAKIIGRIFARFALNDKFGKQVMVRSPRDGSEAVEWSPDAVQLLGLDPPPAQSEHGLRIGFVLESEENQWNFCLPASMSSTPTPDDASWKQWKKLVFPRFLLRRSELVSYPPNSKVQVRGQVGDRFMRIRLNDKDAKLVIRLNSLIGFTDNIGLSSVFDASLAGLAQRRFLLRVAQGPGELILWSNTGNFDLIADADTSTIPEGVVAFDMSSRISVDGTDGWRATLRGRYGLKPVAMHSSGALPFFAADATSRTSTFSIAAKRLLLLFLPI